MRPLSGSFRELTRRRDFHAGGLMVLIGIGVALKGWSSYRIGTLMQMGPGFLPTSLGVILAILGILIAAAAITRAETAGDTERILPEQPQWRGWLCILAGPALFIVCGRYFGMAPATFACVFVSALGDRSATWKSSLILAAVVTVFGTGLFAYVLHVPMPVLTWKGGW